MTSTFLYEKDVKERLDVFLCEELKELTRSHIKIMIEKGYILVNEKQVKAGYELRKNDKIEVQVLAPTKLDAVAEDLPLDIIYEDDDLLVINKAQGMVVHPANGNASGTLVNALLNKVKNLSGINGVIRPGIVHRLDKDTSGLLLVAKNDKAHVSLATQIAKKTCKRYYFAIVEGNPKQEEGTIQTFIGRSKHDRKKMAVVPENEGKLAITNYKVLNRFGRFCFMEFELKTGRTHQIRVHVKELGCTIVGDLTYGHKSKEFALNGQLLHAHKIEFIQPTTQKPLIFEAPLPLYFEQVLNYLKNTLN